MTNPQRDARFPASLPRRDVLRLAALGVLGSSACSWLPAMAQQLADAPSRRRHCVLLWMVGGPSQTDTFDMKPDHPNGGQFKEIATTVPGLRISEHLPQLAAQGGQLAIVRALSTKEGDHGRGTYLMRTGHQPGGPLRYPAIGSSLSKELGREDAPLPNYVSIGAGQTFNAAAFGAGFLGPRYAPLSVGAVTRYQAEEDAAANEDGYAQLGVDFLRLPDGVDSSQASGRLDLWRSLQDRFLDQRGTPNALAHDTVYRRAVQMMYSKASDAFDLSQEPASVRDAYGRGRFGQGCLMARRLIERGVPFVEVALGGFQDGGVGWDTHQNNFPAVRTLSQQLDAGWSSLMRELNQRGLLQSTTILWMGEFGRTPTINESAGRDHYPAAWTCVFAGGGIKGGQAYGKTSRDGRDILEGKVGVEAVLATLCHALGVDPARENTTSLGRPVRIVEGAPIKDILA